jgi:hypothetical protein
MGGNAAIANQISIAGQFEKNFPQRLMSVSEDGPSVFEGVCFDSKAASSRLLRRHRRLANWRGGKFFRSI